MGVGQLLKTGSIFNWQFSFYEIPERYISYNYDTFYASPMHLKVGASDCATGRCHWFSRENGDDLIRDSIASSSMPLLAPMQEIAGRQYLDGGIADSIPVGQAMQDGWEKQVIVLTQNKGYVKKPNKLMPLIRLRYRRYPALCHTMQQRHIDYNRSLQTAQQLERQGKAVIIQPSQPMVLHRVEKDVDKLQAAYENGYSDAAAAWERIQRLFEQE